MCGAPLPKAPAPLANPPRVGPIPAPIGTAAAAVAPQPPLGSRMICPHCGGDTPTAMPFCQHCGQRLGAPAPAAVPGTASRAAAGVASSDAVASTIAVPGGQGLSGILPTPPAGVRVGSGGTASHGAGLASPGTAAHGAASHGAAFAPTVMPSAGQLSALLGTLPARGGTASAPVAPAPAPAPAKEPALPATGAGRATPGPSPVTEVTETATVINQPPPVARLTVVLSDGSDGAAFDLSAEQVDIGRNEGELTFPEDHFLAARHARLELREGRYVIVPLYPRNGVFVRLREPIDLKDDETFLAGKQVFRFERVPDVEREPAAAVEHAVHLFGTPARVPWARLSQITTAGVARDVYHLTRPEAVLGREEGDYVFPDDEFMSRRHVAISENRGRARIEDLGSSNGTYLRLHGERELRPGDMVRLGDQLLRYETAS